MSVSDSCTFSTSVEERRSFSGKSFISWLYLCTIAIIINDKSEKERLTEIHSILQCSNVQGSSISNKTKNCIPRCLTSWLLNHASMPSNALSRFNQKLTSCDSDAVPEETSLVSLITTWMALIQELTCEWREFRNVLSVSSFDGMWETLGRWPCDWAFSKC